MKYCILQVTHLKQNSTLIWCARTNEGVLVDPGGEPYKWQQIIDNKKVKLKYILITHAHIDHVLVAPLLASKYQVPILGPHIDDKPLLKSLPLQSKWQNLPHCDPFEPNRYLQEGDTISFGFCTCKVLHCPGHSPGHIIFFFDKHKLAIVGDVIFYRNIGNTNILFGNYDRLMKSITQKILTLGDDVWFLPGHGRISCIADEKLHNPHLQFAKSFR